MNKTLNDFNSPRWLQCFPTQENLTTKTLNPKVTFFVLSSFSLFNLYLKICKEHLYSSLQLSKLCHILPNRDTVGVYDPRYDQSYPENVPNKPKIVSCFPEIVSRLDTLQNMLTACQNRDTILLFAKFHFWVTLQHLWISLILLLYFAALTKRLVMLWKF